MPTVPASATSAGSRLPGPFPVGSYAAGLRRRLRDFASVQLTGEVWGLRVTRARVYFELRDAAGALPCAMWREDFEALAGRAGDGGTGGAGGAGGAGGTGGAAVGDGTVVVVAGGCDYYSGSATASPSFHFAVRELRLAGEGDLLAQLARLRRRLDAEGLFALQKALPRPLLPRCIGVVCAQSGKARDDIRAGLQRRGWGGRLVWAFAPVQDRRAAPAIAACLRELAATPEIDVVIVARGGGSIADLLAFCDESLCRTVALLRVPVIASVGHHTDRTLLDDVAAVSCSTPTHAAETALGVDVTAARSALGRDAARLRDHGRRADAARGALTRDARHLRDHGRRAVRGRVRVLVALARAGETVAARQRVRLHQLLRELRAAGRRASAGDATRTAGHAAALRRAGRRAEGADAAARRRDLHRLGLALAAHDPARTLARGYALVTDRDERPLGAAADARRAGEVVLHFHDGALEAAVTPEETP